MSKPDQTRIDVSKLNLSDEDFTRLLDQDVLALLEPSSATVAAPAHTPRHATHGQPRAHPALAEQFVDPVEMPFTPQPRRGTTIAARLSSLVVRAVLLALLCWLIIPELNFRFAHKGSMKFNSGVLTAQPVRLSSLRAAEVKKILVDPITSRDEVIPAGTPVAEITEVEGDRTSSRVLTAPFDARLVSVDSPAGTVTRAGDPIVTLYDPTRLVVIITVTADDLTRLKRGMQAEINNRDLKRTFSGRVDSAVPVLGTDHDPATKRLVNVRIVPDDLTAASLLPGTRFRVFVNLRSSSDVPLFVQS